MSSIRLDLDIKQAHIEYQKALKVEQKVKDLLFAFYDIQHCFSKNVCSQLEQGLKLAEQETMRKLDLHNNLVGQDLYSAATQNNKV